MIMSDEGGTYEFETYMLRDEDCEYIRKNIKRRRRGGRIDIPLMRNAGNRQIHYDRIEFPEKHQDLWNYVFPHHINQYRDMPENYESPVSIAEFNSLPHPQKIWETETIDFAIPPHPLTLAFLDRGNQIDADEFSASSLQFGKYLLTDETCRYIWDCVKPPKFKKNFMGVPIFRTRENVKTHFNGVIFPPRYQELEKFVWLSRIEQYQSARFWPISSQVMGGEQLCFIVLSRPLAVRWLDWDIMIPGYTTVLEFPIADA